MMDELDTHNNRKDEFGQLDEMKGKFDELMEKLAALLDEFGKMMS